MRKVKPKVLFPLLGTAALVATCTTLAFGDPKPAAPSAPIMQPKSNTAPIVTGAKVVNVKWISGRRVAMWVYSPSMGKNIQVQMLLAKDWNSKPTEKFPQLYVLDSMDAPVNQSNWLEKTDMDKFFADKNVNVIVPIGGESSFYTNWQKPDNNVNYQWETFLTKELPPIIQDQWRSTDVRGIEGAGMGGTAAMMLAGRNPNFYKYAGSYSGILDLSTTGMPLAIAAQMQKNGGFSSLDMFGDAGNSDWSAHDPLTMAQKYRGVSLYVSSDDGDTTQQLTNLVTSPIASSEQLLSRVTSQRFADQLAQNQIPAQVVYRASGNDSWPDHQIELHDSWPLAAKALGVAPSNPCAVGGAIAMAAKTTPQIGGCITGAYDIPGGKAQDFYNGRIVWTPKTGARILAGPIAGTYVGIGGPAGKLGVPVGNQYTVGKATAQNFQNGVVYSSPVAGAHAMYGPILQAWLKSGGLKSPVGLPNGDQVPAGNIGFVQGFNNGSIFYSPGNGAFPVIGKIYQKYGEQKWEEGGLGFPTSAQIPLANGDFVQRFSGGNIYMSNLGTYIVPSGPMLNAYENADFEKGKLGVPKSDIQIVPGGIAQTFQNGVISIVNGKTIVI